MRYSSRSNCTASTWKFDSRGAGIVDALSIMYAGRTAYEGELWPHNSVQVLTFGNVRTHFYVLTSMGPIGISNGLRASTRWLLGGVAQNA